MHTPEYLTSRIEHIDQVRTAYIMYKDKPVATITEEYSTLSGEADWVFTPIWENIDWFAQHGKCIIIPGIDLSLRKSEYVRRFLPSFVEKRVISKRREDCRELLDELYMNVYDPFEMMCRTHGICGDDPYYISRAPDAVIDVDDPNLQHDVPEGDWY